MDIPKGCSERMFREIFRKDIPKVVSSKGDCDVSEPTQRRLKHNGRANVYNCTRISSMI